MKEKLPYKQITEGGVEKTIEEEMKPLFSIGSTIYGEKLIDESDQVHQNLGYLERLQYPQLFKLK